MTVTATPPAPLDVFYSYAHENKGLVKEPDRFPSTLAATRLDQEPFRLSARAWPRMGLGDQTATRQSRNNSLVC